MGKDVNVQAVLAITKKAFSALYRKNGTETWDNQIFSNKHMISDRLILREKHYKSVPLRHIYIALAVNILVPVMIYFFWFNCSHHWQPHPGW